MENICRKRLRVVKIGGNVIDNEEALEKFLDRFCQMPSPKILVHGGGATATKLSAKLGIPVQKIEGRRVTDEATLKIVTMVYAGLINKHIVAELQKRGCNALGLTGADGNTVPAKKRASGKISWGYVGDVENAKVNSTLLETFANEGIVPVFCALTHDSQGSLLNTNADTMASEISAAMSKRFNVTLIYCFEKQGVLMDKNDDNSVIKEITKEKYASLLREKIISEGMIPKIDNALAALERGVNEVIIKRAENLSDDTGTVIK